MKTKLLLFLRIFVGLILLFIIFRIVPYRKLVFHLSSANPYILIFAFFIFFSTHLLGVLRWKMALAVLGLEVNYRDLFFLFFSGLFLNLVFPSFLAQDVFRGGLLGFKEPRYFKKITVSLIIDRFSGFLALVLIAFISLGLGRSLIREKSICFSVFTLAIIVGVSLIFIFSRRSFKLILFFFKKREKIREKLQEFQDCFYIFAQRPFSFLKITLISLLIQILSVVVFSMLGVSLGVSIRPILYFILVPLITVVASLPLTAAGLGTREVSAVYFFSKAGLEPSLVVGISLMNFFFIVIISVVGGLLYVAFYNRWLQSDK